MKTNNTNTNIKQIVKTNFMIATFDAMNFNYFADNYVECERMLSEAMNDKISKMSEDDIQTFAFAIIDGNEVMFDKEKEDFYLNFK